MEGSRIWLPHLTYDSTHHHPHPLDTIHPQPSLLQDIAGGLVGIHVRSLGVFELLKRWIDFERFKGKGQTSNALAKL
jgi:hypothetical protein